MSQYERRAVHTRLSQRPALPMPLGKPLEIDPAAVMPEHESLRHGHTEPIASPKRLTHAQGVGMPQDEPQACARAVRMR